MSDVSNALREGLLNIARQRSGINDHEIDEQTLLFADRYLTSVHLPELLVFIERTTGRRIDVENLVRSDLQSVEHMVSRFGRGHL